jgi:hypothetical protein
MMLDRIHILAARMQALLLAGATTPMREGRTVAGIVEWFGAMQAQDLASGLWSFGVRLQGATESEIATALERKEALRTWPMRGTIHFVPPRDAKWMLDLMSARPLAGAAKRREALGISTAVAARAVDALGKALSGGQRLTRSECAVALERVGVSTAGQVGYHLLWYASQLGVTCIAPNVGKEQTFALLDEYVSNPNTPDRDEALATMALRYVRGHGPVSVQEFARWTGLGVRDCRAAVASAGKALVSVQTEAGPMLATPEALDVTLAHRPTYLTPPGFDEYMLGYGDRSIMLDPMASGQVVPGNNGMFRATLVRSGRVVGTWKRTMRSTSCVIDAAPLASAEGKRLGREDRTAFEAAFARYGHFVGKAAEVRWT